MTYRTESPRRGFGRSVVATACDAGFTILEVLVALVILGLGLAALSGAVSDSLLRTAHADEEARAARLADGLLARLGADLPLRIGVQSGRDDGIDWTLNVQSYGTDTDRAAWPVAVADVRLTLGWQSGLHRRLATWETLRTAPVDQR